MLISKKKSCATILFLIVLTWKNPTTHAASISNSTLQEVSVSLNATEGDTIELFCQANGYVLVWYKIKEDNRHIIAVGTSIMTYEYSNRLQITDEQLTIRNARVEDSGIYICEPSTRSPPSDPELRRYTFLLSVTAKGFQMFTYLFLWSCSGYISVIVL